MKFKFIFFLVIIVFSNFSTFAQHNIKSGIIIGFNGYTETAASDRWVHSIIAGAIVDISIAKLIGIEIGTEYLQRGASRISTRIYPYYDTAITNKNYLVFPVHTNIKMPWRLVTPYGIIGVNLGVLLSAKDHISNIWGAYETDATKRYPTLDFGYDIGFGIDFNLKTFTTFFQAIANGGLINLDKQKKHSHIITDGGYEIKSGIKLNLN
jgi:hypothetical protein